MYYDNKIWIGESNGKKVSILPSMANRHGLIAGATGTGKTVTLKVLAESFSNAGVPVFLADIKGDLSGMCRPGVRNADMEERIGRFGLDACGFQFQEYPTVFWDIYGQMGIPLRTTVTEMGPVLLAKLFELTPAQEDVLNICFRIADDQGLLLIDTKDLKSMLQYLADNSREFSSEYGNIPKQSVTTIIRRIVAMETKGAEAFFAEPALNIADWFATDMNGKGQINVLDCRQLVNDTSLYSVFLLWMLSELFETLPEVGDMAKPRMVFFFDEAHLLFHGIPAALLEKIEQVVKLIRSKGVGVYFITQNPKDIPDSVLSQLGNKVQHALRAYTPAEEKGIKAAASSFRVNPEFDTKKVLSELGTGEALISTLDESGIPSVVERCKVLPPQSQMGSIPDEEKLSHTRMNNLYLRYQNMVDRDSAYEFFERQKQQGFLDQEAAQKKELEDKEKSKKQKAAKAGVRSVASTAAGTIGREFGNNIGKSLGGSFGKRLGGNVGASICRNILGTLFK